MGLWGKKKQETKIDVELLMQKIESAINATESDEIRNEFKIVVLSLVGFFAKENPKLFTKGKEESWYLKEFLKTIVSFGTGAMLDSQSAQKKVADFMELFPIIQKYANIEE